LGFVTPQETLKEYGPRMVVEMDQRLHQVLMSDGATCSLKDLVVAARKARRDAGGEG
jgi:hypothetical protein